MSANNNQTNRNSSRYFFATTENGEQQLGLQYGTTGGVPNLSTMAVTITGDQGNGVIVNTAPSFQATDYIFAEQGMGVYGSTYFTPSTLATTITGINLSSDRVPGSGVACIESYRGNGSLGGFEFLSRTVGGELYPMTYNSNMANYVSSLGWPGATAILKNGGVFVTGLVQSADYQAIDAPYDASGSSIYDILDLSGPTGLTGQLRWSIGKYGLTTGGNAGSDFALYNYADNQASLGSPLTIKRSNGAATFTNLSSVNGVMYPQNLISSLMSGPQTVTAASNAVTVLYQHTSANTSNMIAGQNYLVDIPSIIATAAPGGSGAWLDVGVRLGGNGAFNYAQSIFIPPGGTPGQGISQGLVQICDTGSANKNVDIVGYLQGVATLSITTSQVPSGNLAYLKMLT